MGVNGDDSSSETAVAFSSYLNHLSTGEITAPNSPQLVADYLDSLNGENMNRLSNIENRVNSLESSVNQLPDKISSRMEQWQGRQEERLASEFNKIESYLVSNSCVNGESLPAVNGVNGDSSGAVNGVNGGSAGTVTAANGDSYLTNGPPFM